MNKWEQLAGFCDSPIEELLALALGNVWDENQVGLLVSPPLPFSRVATRLPQDLVVIPQARMETPSATYRLDFLFVCGDRPGVRQLICVECDGHDWHEKTKEQAARDKRRDRALLICGVPTVRFAGSEIHADANACAEYILDLVEMRYADYLQAEARRA